MGNKYKAYPEYKDSGVEWLGEIPSTWTVCRVKNIAELNPSKSELKNHPDDYQVSFLPMEAIGEQGQLGLCCHNWLVEVVYSCRQ